MEEPTTFLRANSLDTAGMTTATREGFSVVVEGDSLVLVPDEVEVEDTGLPPEDEGRCGCAVGRTAGWIWIAGLLGLRRRG